MKLTGIVSPEMEFNHPEKGDALHAMELALSLEVFTHLLWLIDVINTNRQNFLEAHKVFENFNH